MATKRILFALLTLLAISFASAPAFACKCPRGIDPVTKSKSVFYGTVSKVTQRGSNDRVEFQIEKLYKGEEKDLVQLYVNRFEHDCGLRMEEGEKYMVYAIDFYPRGVATTMCLGTHQSDEPPAGEDGWKDIEVEIPDPTDVESKMRKIARSIATKCANDARVPDAGFALVLSSNGDPMRPTSQEKLSPRDDKFAQCMADEFMQRNDLPAPEETTLIKGWWQQSDRNYPILLDELPCDETCTDWFGLVKSALLAVRLPAASKPTEDASAQEFGLESDRQKCVREGLDSILSIPESGGRSAVRRRNTMLVECAIARAEFGRAMELAGEADVTPAFFEAIKWAYESTSSDQKAPTPQGDAGAAPAADTDAVGSYPVSTDLDSFPTFYFEERGKPDAGDFRVLRSAFVGSQGWASQPLFLEAFAQSVVSDESASEPMRNLAALAYRKAARLVPSAEAEYRELARKASSSNGVDLLVAELDEAYQKAVAAHAKQQAMLEPKIEAAPQTNAGAQTPQPDQPNNLVVIAGGLFLLIAIAGGLFVFSRRKKA